MKKQILFMSLVFMVAFGVGRLFSPYAAKSPDKNELTPALVQLPSPPAVPTAPTDSSHLQTDGDALKARFTQILSSLPKVSELARARSDADPHPPLLQSASLRLGEVASLVARIELTDTEQVDAVVQFYDQCVRSQEMLTSVRAVCLRDLKAFSKRAHRLISEGDYPANIVVLARHL